MRSTRRDFLRSATATAMGLAGLRAAFPNRVFASDGPGARPGGGFGPLVEDPAGLVDLPEGFTYRVLSRAGAEMDDGLLVPGKHDGMAAFRGERGRVILMRNHELEPQMTDLSPYGPKQERLGLVDRARLFDPTPALGGVTAVEFDEDAFAVTRHHMALAGTKRNCAGGPTPWGTWISCEEDVTCRAEGFSMDHGWCFEVPATMDGGLVQPVALRAMGRFYHEAVAVDPRTSIVYLTEDRADGLFYRFLPRVPGRLAEGGTLQALALLDQPSGDTRNLEGLPIIAVGSRTHVRWIDLEDVESLAADDLRHRGFGAGAARFARGEGIWFADGSVYIACTDGGPRGLGQMWRYRPSPAEGSPQEHRHPGSLELWVESLDGSILKNCDNLTVAPWGDVLVCEDGAGNDRVMGITPAGETYPFARNIGSTGECAGVCVSPSGRTVFFNLQEQAVTIAVQGPFPRV